VAPEQRLIASNGSSSVISTYFPPCLRRARALHFDLGRAARRRELAARVGSSYLDPVAALLAEGVSDGSLRRVEDGRMTAVAILGATSTAAIHVLAIDDRSTLNE
jgi:hypothetical protein